MFNIGKSPEKTRATAWASSSRLGAGSRWQGEIQAGPEGLCIEGRLDGTITSEGQVVVAAGGHVKGTIHARNLTVRGRVEGILKVAECLQILGSGWVEGEVELGTLVVDEGATLQGTCVRREAAREKEPLPLVPRREERLTDRFALPSSGTHGPVPDHAPPVRGYDRSRY
jgi:cytoskeletal protein CcmA (bactofilin family)